MRSIRLWPPRRGVASYTNAYLDGIVRREAKLNYVFKLKNFLLRQRRWSMTLLELKQLKREHRLGAMRSSYFASDHPLVFVTRGQPAEIQFTSEAKALLEEQCGYRDGEQHRKYVVQALTKLLMMSLTREIRVDKVSRLWLVLGFPPDYETSVFLRYPDQFTVIEGRDGFHYLKLANWDPSLAVSAREKWLQQRTGPRNNFHAFPEPGNKLKLTNTELCRYFETIQRVKFPSPYEDVSYLDPASPAAAKRALAVLHEILSLTVEKRSLLDHLTPLRREFMLPNDLLGFLLQHRGLFYVSRKENRLTVFLREAYDESTIQFIGEKHPLWRLKERFLAMAMSTTLEEFDKPAAKGSAYEDQEIEVDAELEEDFVRYPNTTDLNDFDGWCLLGGGAKEVQVQEPRLCSELEAELD